MKKLKFSDMVKVPANDELEKIKKNVKKNNIRVSNDGTKIIIDDLSELADLPTLEQIYAEIREIRNRKPANEETKKVIDHVSKIEHIQEMFEKSHNENKPRVPLLRVGTDLDGSEK